MTIPVIWSEGDTPTKAKLDTYIAALQEVEAVFGEDGYLFASQFFGSAAIAHMTRSRRYLHFRSNGLLEDPEAVEDDITLTENPDTGRGTLDLDDTWIGYGALFRLSGINAAWQDDEL